MLPLSGEAGVGVRIPGDRGRTEALSLMRGAGEPRVVAFVSTVLIVVTSGYALVTTDYSSALYLLLLPGALATVLAALLRTRGRIGTRGTVALTGFVVLMLLALGGIVLNPSSANIQAQLKLAFATFFAACIVTAYPFEVLARRFADAIVAVSVVGLIGYALVALDVVPIELPLIENVNGVVYRSAFVFFTFDGFLQYRNVAVFWEPGIFASMIFAALLSDLLISKDVRIWRLVVLLISLATTFSGAAAILFVLYVLIVVAQSSSVLSSARTLPKIAAVLGVSLLVLLRTPVLQDGDFWAALRVLEKVTDVEGMQATRLLSPTANLSLFVEKPVWGWGLSESLTRHAFLFPDTALTSTSAYYLAAFGIGGSLLTILPVLGILVLSRVEFMRRWLLVAAYLFILNKEPHTYFTVTHVINLYLLTALVSRARAAVPQRFRSAHSAQFRREYEGAVAAAPVR